MKRRGICLLLVAIFLLQAHLLQAACSLKGPRQEIGLYERAGFLISADGEWKNPFDPSEVEVSLQIECPDGELIHWPAFYFQDYERRFLDIRGRRQEWVYPKGKPTWKACFAPTKLGKYRARALLRDKRGRFFSNLVSFSCIPSGSRGFLRVCEKDRRFLELSTGEAFFPLGHNLAFLGYGQFLGSLEKIKEVFEKLSKNGANFARIWAGAGDWALAIEWNKSAWSRTWQRISPVAPAPGLQGKRCVKVDKETRLSPCARVCLKPNTLYRLACTYRTCDRRAEEASLKITLNGRAFYLKGTSKWKEWKTEFRTGPGEWFLQNMSFIPEGCKQAYLFGLSLREVAGGPELLYEAQVNRPQMGFYNLRDAFLLDEILSSAQTHGLYLQVCLLSNPTRDLYMDKLKDPATPEYREAIEYAKRIFRYAVSRWGAYRAVGVWEFFNEMNPSLPTDRFYSQVGGYIKSLDIYRRPITTSAWHSNPRDWKHPALDLAQEHYYIRPGTKGITARDEVAAVLNRVEFLRQHTQGRKPVMIGEFGLATPRWGRSPLMLKDKKSYHFHNSLWGSALSGSAGCALFWWWEALDRMNAYGHYMPLSKFLKEIPFTKGNLSGFSGGASDPKVGLLGLKGRDCAYFWLYNKDGTWYSRLIQGKRCRRISACKVILSGLKRGSYRFAWWDTWRGREIRKGRIFSREGRLKLEVPQFENDIAGKLVFVSN